MTLEEYRRQVSSLPYGKRLPNAVYVYRDGDEFPNPLLAQILAHLIDRFELGEQFNVIKFRTDAPKTVIPQLSALL